MTEALPYQEKTKRNERRLEVRGVDYCIHEWGDPTSPVLFYLHGWADTGSTFQFVVDALAKDWFVVAPDWRGFGKSLCECQTYWFPDYLADLNVLLSHYSTDNPVRLIGHSMGANVAALYAGTLPGQVREFINIEGFGLPNAEPAEAPERFRRWIVAQQERQTFSTYRNFSALASRIKMRNPQMSVDKAEFVARHWGYKTVSGAVQLHANPAHKLPNPILYRRAEAEACWRGITARTLLISGDKGPLALSMEGLDSLPFVGAKHQVIEGCGHMLHFEDPEAVATLIEDFLGKPL